MAKKRFRPRSGQGNSNNSSNSGQNRSGGGSGNGSGRRRRKPGYNSRRGSGGGAPQADNEPEGDVELVDGLGLLEMHPNGYGFLRSPENNYSRERTDPFVPGTMIDKFGLRPGLMITGKIQGARRQQGPRLRVIEDVDGMKPEEY